VKCFHYFVFLACCSTALTLSGQSLRQQAEKSEKTEAGDALGRNTPNGTVFGFLEAARNGRYKDASQYLQMSRDARAANGARIARELYVLMESAFVERVGVISGHTEGSHQIGVPRDHQRIGVFRINGTDTNVDLVHVPDPTSGEIWLFSSQVVGEIPDLFAQVETGEAELGRSHLQVIRRFLNTFPRRLTAMLALVPASLGLGWMLVFALRGVVRIFSRWRHYSIAREVLKSLTAPLSLILAVILHQIGVYLLGIPLVTRLHYQRVIGVLLILGIAWLVFRLINVWSNQARARTLDSSDFRSGSIILLGQRISKVLVIIVAGLLTLSILGFDITTAIAGLGIGSIALAFAAQKTLENLLGGVSILGDEVIRIGEMCKIGERQGTVEDISLRSTRIRTLECTVLSVPNGELARMNLENISRREKTLFHTTLGLQYESSPRQLRSLLDKITSLLRQHPKIESEALRVRLVGFGEAGFEVEINCHILTSNLDEFMAIREDLLLRIVDLVFETGATLAIPSRVLYLSEAERQALPNPNPRDRHRAA
jgi:MscS family membrane protein